jgi:hypothetical protein
MSRRCKKYQQDAEESKGEGKTRVERSGIEKGIVSIACYYVIKIIVFFQHIVYGYAFL